MEQLIGLIAFLSFQNDPFKDPIFLFFVPVSDQSLCPYTHLQTGKNPESTHPINTCFLAHIREFLYFNHIQICLTKALSGEREEVRGRNSVKANLVSSSKKKKNSYCKRVFSSYRSHTFVFSRSFPLCYHRFQTIK